MYNFLGTQVAVVDDKENEISGIVEALQNKGIGCKFFNADISDGDSMPPETISNVKILFLDLFYNVASDTDFDPDLAAGWVDSIIPIDSFYVLVIWSKDTHKAQPVLDELKRISKAPLLTLIKQKSDYRDRDEFLFDKLVGDIETEIRKNPSLSELLHWQQGVSNAMNNVISTICQNQDDLDTKIKKIVFAQGGRSLLLEPAELKREALYTAMDEVLSSRAKHHRVISAIPEHVKELYRDIETTPGVDTELNSWFIFEKDKFESNKFEAGVIFTSTDDKLASYTFSNDEVFRDLRPASGDSELKKKNIFMIINPGCNIAQGKLGAGYKFVSGIIANSLSGSSKKKIDSFKTIPDIKVIGFDKGILLFDMRYVFTIPASEIENYDINALVQLSKSVFNDVQIAYTSYSSRIGYTSLR